ncbi:MAG: carboxypeptidase-like regulatory domain-containing protein [Bacteroidales bacterium]|nr:carboxypeptidase-like regulatory domain-containing protein [Bacteroidales bacterium]
MRSVLNNYIGLLLIVTLLFPSIMLGQDSVGKISGYVFDSINNEPIPFAAVRLGNINKTTNFDGYFVFDSIPKGNYTLIASFWGYCDYEIEINPDTLYNDLTLKLSPGGGKYEECDYIIVYRDRVLGQTSVRLEPNPYYKNLDSLMFPILEMKNKDVKHVLDTVISYVEKHRDISECKYYSLRIEKTANRKLMDISPMLYPGENKISKPDGVLRYKEKSFYVFGDFHNVLRIDKEREKEGAIYYENKIGTLDTLHFYFKQKKRGFETIRIVE